MTHKTYLLSDLERKYDILAESHAELIAALDSVLSTGYDIPGTDEIPGGDWGITAETKSDAQAVLTKARKL